MNTKSRVRRLAESPRVIRDYVLNGRSQFTIVSLKTGHHYTYRISRARFADHSFSPWFVSFERAVGSGQYTYFGFISPASKELIVTKERERQFDCVRAFQWWWHWISTNHMPKDCEVWRDVDEKTLQPDGEVPREQGGARDHGSDQPDSSTTEDNAGGGEQSAGADGQLLPPEDGAGITAGEG
jgi:hypothetical protein